MLLDHTKAFYMISHDLFLAIAHYVGLDKSAMNMVKNYLQGRTHQVVYEGVISEKAEIKRGISQGSILGPLHFKFCVQTICSSALI